jgi:predicted  nucleic acid-binding Zn-ribbon protein
MTTQTKILIALSAALTLSLAVSAIWSSRKISELERRAEDAAITAEKLEHEAVEAEKRAAEYIQKIEFLEAKAAEIRTETRRQDEKLTKATANVRDARRNVERTRGTGQTSTDERGLCEELAAVGHGCQ